MVRSHKKGCIDGGRKPIEETVEREQHPPARGGARFHRVSAPVGALAFRFTFARGGTVPVENADTVGQTAASVATAADADIRARLLDRGGVTFPREIPIRVIRVIRERKTRKELA